MVSGTTLSGQSENIRGVGVVRWTEEAMLREVCLWKNLKVEYGHQNLRPCRATIRAHLPRQVASKAVRLGHL